MRWYFNVLAIPALQSLLEEDLERQRTETSVRFKGSPAILKWVLVQFDVIYFGRFLDFSEESWLQLDVMCVPMDHVSIETTNSFLPWAGQSG